MVKCLILAMQLMCYQLYYSYYYHSSFNLQKAKVLPIPKLKRLYHFQSFGYFVILILELWILLLIESSHPFLSPVKQ